MRQFSSAVTHHPRGVFWHHFLLGIPFLTSTHHTLLAFLLLYDWPLLLSLPAHPHSVSANVIQSACFASDPSMSFPMSPSLWVSAKGLSLFFSLYLALYIRDLFPTAALTNEVREQRVETHDYQGNNSALV